MAEFPHLKLTATLQGKNRPRPGGGGGSKNARTLANVKNRAGHGRSLMEQTDIISQRWNELVQAREAQELPALPQAVPLFLEIDSDQIDPDKLHTFGIELISVEEDGLIIGASSDVSLTRLKDKIQKFLDEQGRSKDQAAQLWAINKGEKWRIEQILPDDLQAQWENINDAEQYIADISIACYVNISDQPEQKEGEPDQRFQAKLEGWRKRKKAADIARDELMWKRQDSFTEFIHKYNGELIDNFIEYHDSFTIRVEVTGQALKDLVLNYPYLFEVNLFDPYQLDDGTEEMGFDLDTSFSAPDPGAPKVCVIDSGIQEKHRYLADSIQSSDSKSYIPGDDDTADYVDGGGHGTRVAGAILFENHIPRSGNHKHIAWLQNARILDKNNGLPAKLVPPALMARIIADYPDTKLFNLSISMSTPCRRRHMSAWAAAIDNLNWKKDSLFIIAAGNINPLTGNIRNPGIIEHLAANRHYPDYLLEDSARIATPGSAAFAITVGSISPGQFKDENLSSFGSQNDPSSFSRTGPGLWGMIKPDVVEYGGDWVYETAGRTNLRTKADTSPELIRTTVGGGPAVSSDRVGTSFSAPKVTHLAALIQSEWPNESSTFYRALIAQSARWPDSGRNMQFQSKLKHFGYGLPSSKRALDNAKSRITFVANNRIRPKQAQLFSVKIPAELRKAGDDHKYLLEVTLAYKARIRRTRQKTKSYVSTWVDWISAKLGESEAAFKQRAVKLTESIQTEQEDSETVKWTIREQNNYGKIKDVKRNDSSLQKDWVILNSYELPETLNFAVIGHKGWEKDLSQEVPYTIIISLECLNPEIVRGHLYSPPRGHLYSAFISVIPGFDFSYVHGMSNTNF